MQPIGKGRLENFSDGVFAIAMTLLALELPIPHFFNSSSVHWQTQIAPFLPTILTYILSFITIAIFWVNHHQLTQNFTSLEKRRIVWTNIFFLMFLTLVPFVTEAISLNPGTHLGVFFYSIVLFGASVFFSILRYFVHKGCGEAHVPMVRSLIGPTFYLLAAIASLYVLWISYILLAVTALFYFLPKHSK